MSYALPTGNELVRDGSGSPASERLCPGNFSTRGSMKLLGIVWREPSSWLPRLYSAEPHIAAFAVEKGLQVVHRLVEQRGGRGVVFVADGWPDEEAPDWCSALIARLPHRA